MDHLRQAQFPNEPPYTTRNKACELIVYHHSRLPLAQCGPGAGHLSCISVLDY